MRRATGRLWLTGLVLVLGWPLPVLAGAFQPTDAAASGVGLRADFNGDGAADLAIGVPLEDTSAGVVHVLYGSTAGLVAAGSQLWSQDSPGIAGAREQGDEFGSALAGGDFNGDGRADLAIGADGENGFRGVVHVLHGSASGLVAAGSQLWSQGGSGIGGLAEASDSFGHALASGDFNGDGTADLAIGAPGENDFAGVAQVLYGSGSGLAAAGNQLWSQDTPGIAGVAELADQFGIALAAGDFNGDGSADLAVDAVGENVVAGVVHVLYGSGSGLAAAGSQLWSQGNFGIGGLAEPGDHFGFALAAGDFNGDGPADLAIGAPGENAFRGVTQVLYGSGSGLVAAGSQLWSQGSSGIGGLAEDNDSFGDSLAAGDFNGDGDADLAVAAPGENGFAGVVQVLYGSAAGLAAAGNQLWSQDSPGVDGVAEAGDELGFGLAAGDFSGDGQADLAIGAPAESFGGLQSAGVVHVLYGSAAGLAAAGSQLWTQESPGIADGAEDSDFFGDPLAAGSLSTGDTGTATAAGRSRSPTSQGRR